MAVIYSVGSLKNFHCTIRNTCINIISRNKRTLAFKHIPLKSLEEFMADRNKKSVLEEDVDIGFPPQQMKRSEYLKERLSIRIKNKNNEQLQRLSRLRKLKIPLDEVEIEWKKTIAPNHIKTAAEHYGIFQDLYRHAYFVPWTIMDVHYSSHDDFVNPVFRGNIIHPSEVQSAPTVSYSSDDNSLWTLIMTSLDSHLTDHSSEYLHWMIGNIPGNDVGQGEELCDYLQPFPVRGTGYHRFVFVLYKQEAKIDYSDMKKPVELLSLDERTFKTFDFYKSRQDLLTPSGLSFFQSTWDESLTDFFHDKLNMKEPIFEYVKPVHTFKGQIKYPHQKPFNLYLDHYRDPKEINKEILVKRLRNLNPFEPERPQSEYPQIFHLPRNTPSWRKDEIRRERARVGKYSHL